MRFCIDVDGTICTQEEDYADARPIPEVIDKIHAVKNAGHEVVIFTARGSGTGIDWKDITERQLSEWNVPYDDLLFGKPPADVYIDDRAINVRDWGRGYDV